MTSEAAGERRAQAADGQPRRPWQQHRCMRCRLWGYSREAAAAPSAPCEDGGPLLSLASPAACR